MSASCGRQPASAHPRRENPAFWTVSSNGERTSTFRNFFVRARTVLATTHPDFIHDSGFRIDRRSGATATGSVRDVACRQVLSSDEEIKLATLIANGDREARNRMVQANLRLVVTIARGFRGRGLEFDDLVGEGNLGLIRAAEKFDPRFGRRFSIYASYWIKEAIRNALLKTASTIRLPCHMVVLLTKWRRAERVLSDNGTACRGSTKCPRSWA